MRICIANTPAIPIPAMTAMPLSQTQIALAATYLGIPFPKTFNFEFAPAVNGPYTSFAPVSGPVLQPNTATLTDTGLSAAQTRYYRVRVQTQDGRFTPYSPVMSATTQAAVVGNQLVWNPAIRIRTGSYASMGSLASIKAVTDALWGPGGSDVNDALAGVCLSPTWRQLEGDTLGDYSAGFSSIGAIINLMKSYSPPKDVSIFVNGGGNGWTAQSSAPGGFCPAYMQNSTYGGGMVWSGLDRPYIVIWNQNVVNRLIALVQAYTNHFGPDTPTGGIYRWDTYQEISINSAAPGYSPSALLTVFPSWMAGIRAAAPNSPIISKPTFINPNTGASYPSIISAMRSNFISMSSEDCSGSGHNDWAQTSYLGAFPGFTTVNYTTNNGGNPGWDFHCNVDPGELWNTSNGNAAIPPATTGSGYIYDVSGNDIWSKVKQMKASHVDIYIDGYGGPNVNRRVFSASAPANPPLGPGAGLVAAHPNVIDVLGGNTAYSGVLANGCAIPWTLYPAGYP